ncbi:translation initiation factor IF-2-like, partial [Sturnira hondurensis]|uniref:translation initiation factor IF-2-like n=1 Tax=Sturnira hondurensis TaxID=192404 RepID=UPI0018790C40
QKAQKHGEDAGPRWAAQQGPPGTDRPQRPQPGRRGIESSGAPSLSARETAVGRGPRLRPVRASPDPRVRLRALPGTSAFPVAAASGPGRAEAAPGGKGGDKGPAPAARWVPIQAHGPLSGRPAKRENGRYQNVKGNFHMFAGPGLRAPRPAFLCHHPRQVTELQEEDPADADEEWAPGQRGEGQEEAELPSRHGPGVGQAASRDRTRGQ